MDKLTYREKQILHCLTEGLSNTQIAERLFTSEATVKTTIQRLFEKTGVRGRVSLALLAERAKYSQIQIS